MAGGIGGVACAGVVSRAVVIIIILNLDILVDVSIYAPIALVGLVVADIDDDIAARVEIAGVTVVISIAFLKCVCRGEHGKVCVILCGCISVGVEIKECAVLVLKLVKLIVGVCEEGNNKAKVLIEECLFCRCEIGVEVTGGIGGVVCAGVVFRAVVIILRSVVIA